MKLIRLDKYLSSQLNISRTDAKKLLKGKSVTLNGKTVVKADADIDTENDRVCVSGNELKYKEHIYIMLNKPKGVVSASFSPGDITVVDLVPDDMKRSGLFPAGRLDKDTTGFVLITDDGEFAHNILSPSHHISKTYEVTVEREVTKEELEEFTTGMIIDGEKFKSASLRFICMNTEHDMLPQYEIIITEGRYHQIKRMFASSGNSVVELNRSAMGMLVLDEKLKPGECREITASELALIVKNRIL